MELTLREYILYLERRLNTSALGSLGLNVNIINYCLIITYYTKNL